METRILSFANSAVAIHFAGRRSRHIIDLLYARIPGADGVDPHADFHLVPGVLEGELSLYRNGRLLYDGDSEGQLANVLMGDSIYQLADRSRNGLLLHAAALQSGDKGLLLPGATGSGKSTLSAWLMRQGLGYLTDELVFIPEESDRMQAFTRPLNIKTPARPVLDRDLAIDTGDDALLCCQQAVLIPPARIGAVGAGGDVCLNAILFPRFQADGSFELVRLSPAQAGLRLMECLINARNLPEHGFPEVTRLARTVPAYALSYGAFDQLGDRLAAVFDADT